LPPPNTSAPVPGKPSSGSSFLDEWLAKRKTVPQSVAASTATSTAPTPSAASTAPSLPPASASSMQTPTSQPTQQAPASEPTKKPGELKVSHHDGDGQDGDQVHTVKIDREGNLTYDQ
jgi:hypothetical protein